MTATTERDELLRELEADMLKTLNLLGFYLEKGHFPYGREVAKLLFPVPNYKPSCQVLETAGRGIAMALRTGQLDLTLED